MTAPLSTVSAVDHRDDDGAGPDGDGATLVLVLEGERPLAASSRHDLRGLDQVAIGRAPTRSWTRTTDGATRQLALGVPDPRMSQQHARLVRALDRWALEDAGAKNGVTVNGAKVARVVLDDGDRIELGHTWLVFRQPTPPALPPDLDAAALVAPAPGLATLVPALARSFADLALLAPTATPILLHGETGTGKEVVARAVHALTGRTGPFVAVNCGALPATLVESELFGYRKGAFSGAVDDRPGLVRSADGGTLFLDEIGDLSPPAQAALLRVLQEREVVPLGATRPVAVDVALVAATHHDLPALVDAGRFRRDLYARLAGFVVRLPALRDRKDDLGLLIAALVRKRAPDPAAVRFTDDALRAIAHHDWPLNVRELEAALGVAVALARGGPIEAAHLPEPVRLGAQRALAGAAAAAVAAASAPASASAPDAVAPAPAAIALATDDAVRREQLDALLRAHAGNISAIARLTGRSRIQVHRWLQRFGLDPADYR